MSRAMTLPRQLGLLCLASAALQVSVAHAQVDAERFKPAVTNDGWVNAEGSTTRHPDDAFELGAFLNFSKHALVTVDGEGELNQTVVDNRLGIDLLGSMSFTERFSIGLGLPAYVQSGDVDPSTGGLGDLRLVPKYEILSDRESIGLALAAELRAPTHTGDFSGGARNVQVIPKVIIDHRFRSGWRAGGNVGAAIRETSTFFNIVAGNEFVYAAALGYRFGGLDGDTEVGFELNGALGLEQLDAEESPLEAFLFARHDLNPEWEIIGGPGVGLIEGYGVPTFRGFIGVRYRPTSHDQDNDGIADSVDQCPRYAEDRDGIEDADGCPEEDPDSDRDGVADVDDECPEDKETINGHDDDDGCPDSGDPRVLFEDGKFKILDTIEFEHGSADVKPESSSLLDQIAQTMKANPDIERIRVEGHTDDTGPRDVNVRLSQQRASAVRKHLVDRGVSPQRLTSEGYGPDRPLESGTGDEARARNRRVEFIVE